MDTSNKFMVSQQGERIVILRPAQSMSRDDALNLAAWIVALSDTYGGKFQKLIEEVSNT